MIFIHLQIPLSPIFISFDFKQRKSSLTPTVVQCFAILLHFAEGTTPLNCGGSFLSKVLCHHERVSNDGGDTVQLLREIRRDTLCRLTATAASGWLPPIFKGKGMIYGFGMSSFKSSCCHNTMGKKHSNFAGSPHL